MFEAFQWRQEIELLRNGAKARAHARRNRKNRHENNKKRKRNVNTPQASMGITLISPLVKNRIHDRREENQKLV